MHRNTDPDTAVAAAESIDCTYLENVVHACLVKRGALGGTTEELAVELKLPRVTVSPRMAPLKRKGRVRETPMRRKGSSGRTQIVWAAA